MPYRLEIALKQKLTDPDGNRICRKAADYLNIKIDLVRKIDIITIDADFSDDQLKIIKNRIFTNPVIQFSSYQPLSVPFDWSVFVGFKPGVKDNPASTAIEAIEDVLGIKFTDNQAVYTAKRYCFKGSDLNRDDVESITRELLANDIIQQWKIFSLKEWDGEKGIGYILPRVDLNHEPVVSTISIETDESLEKTSIFRNLALNPNDIPTIRSYFLNKDVIKERLENGLSDPTDIELEYISQSRSDHCNHNTFCGKFFYKDLFSKEEEVIDSLFDTYIKNPTLLLKEKKEWIVSVLWDNAGVGKFDREHNYVITGETHNSPSNMEAYGGAITGIVGVYRDPLGTGKGSKLVMGGYGFCTGDRDYNGDLSPKLHPRRLLDGIIEGVKDGGNKSGIPTTFGQVLFDFGYMGKCLVFVTAVGIMPSSLNGEPADKKTTSPGDLIIMCGGRVGKDGIHGVTASSESFSENTPAGHVQIGDPYTQKKMHDFIIEARDLGLISFITDNGGGGLSSSVGESAEFSGGCVVDLEKVPLKYYGLDQWEIWISESQERMTVAIHPSACKQFMELSERHAVKSTVIGVYTDSGKLHIKYNNDTCAYVNLDLIKSGFPQWEFDACWIPPEMRGMYEPVIGEPADYDKLLSDILSRPNICSKEWISLQYDHEVQGTSVIKNLAGVEHDVAGDASVIRPVLDSNRGLAFSQAILPFYSQIDAYHMTSNTIDEAVRRIIAVGGDFEHIGGVDNFCWPGIAYDPCKNPDGRFKAAQLVRSCKALKDVCMAYEIPLLSGKDSMYVDGHLQGPFGETRKVSALETMQFSAISVVKEIEKCVTMDAKVAGDLVYILGETKDELGGSEYYQLMGYVGLNVPVVDLKENRRCYKALNHAIDEELVASVHGVFRGGLAVHLAMVAMAGNLGLECNLKDIPEKSDLTADTILFSESAGRFIVTVDSKNREKFEKIFKDVIFACAGRVTLSKKLVIKKGDKTLVSTEIKKLKSAYKRLFGSLR